MLHVYTLLGSSKFLEVMSFKYFKHSSSRSVILSSIISLFLRAPNQKLGIPLQSASNKHFQEGKGEINESILGGTNTRGFTIRSGLQIASLDFRLGTLVYFLISRLSGSLNNISALYGQIRQFDTKTSIFQENQGINQG